MFDLISGEADRALAHQDPRVLLISSFAHSAIGALLVAVPLLYVIAPPPAPTMMAFVAAPPVPPPPPPPPAPAATAEKAAPKPASTPGRFAAPIEAPREIRPETGTSRAEGGVPGGVEGGIPGGVLGSVGVGLLPPSPPPPVLPSPRAPVRVGGSVQAPTLLHRVDPVYPASAVSAKIGGVVIVEALVDESGAVKSVKVLRSHPLLERAAVEAVRQWRYSPLILNGEPQTFVLTVTLTFNVR